MYYTCCYTACTEITALSLSEIQNASDNPNAQISTLNLKVSVKIKKNCNYKLSKAANMSFVITDVITAEKICCNTFLALVNRKELV